MMELTRPGTPWSSSIAGAEGHEKPNRVHLAWAGPALPSVATSIPQPGEDSPDGCWLGEHVVGGDDHGIDARPAVQRRRSVVPEDPGGAAVRGQGLAEGQQLLDPSQSPWPVELGNSRARAVFSSAAKPQVAEAAAARRPGPGHCEVDAAGDGRPGELTPKLLCALVVCSRIDQVRVRRCRSRYRSPGLADTRNGPAPLCATTRRLLPRRDRMNGTRPRSPCRFRRG